MDKVTALNASQAITAALLAVSRGRGGQHIELSMIDAAIHFLFADGKWNQTWPDLPNIPVEWANGHRQTEFNCSDGKVTITYACKYTIFPSASDTCVSSDRSLVITPGDQFVDTRDPPGTRLRKQAIYLYAI